MSLTGLLNTITQEDTEIIYYLDSRVVDCISYEEYMTRASQEDNFFERKVRTIRKSGEYLRKYFLTFFRAELAKLEIVSALGDTSIDPLLVRISPRYLQCPIIQKRLYKAKLDERYGRDTINAREYVDGITKEFKYSGVTKPKRQVPYWGLAQLYQELFQALHKVVTETYFQRIPEEQMEEIYTQFRLKALPIAYVNNMNDIHPLIIELIMNSSDMDDNPTLPPHLCLKRPPSDTENEGREEASAKKNLRNALASVQDKLKDYQHCYLIPHVKFFDELILPDKDLQWLHQYQAQAWDLLERVGFTGVSFDPQLGKVISLSYFL